MRFVKILTATVALSQLFSLVSAVCSNFGKNCPQDAPCCNNGWCSNDPKFCSTGCEPANSFSPKSCFPEPPCVSLYDDFSKPSIVNWQNFSGDPTTVNWTSDFTPDYTSYTSDGFGSTVSSTRWMEYGTVTARIKTGSTAKGVVSSFIGSHHKVGADTTADFHLYTIEWMPDHISWIIDGVTARTAYQKDTWDSTLNQFKFPSRPSRIQFSMWDGGMGAEGTANWAGSPTDWSDQNKVYSMYVDWVNITCFYNGNSSTTWPPEGYGPPKKPNGSSTDSSQSYATLGAGLPNSLAAPGTNGSQITPNTPDYSQPTLPKLVAPIAALCSVTVLAAAGYGAWRYRRSRGHINEPYVKQMY
ncbi:3976_t:CDS:2 [Ambispora gerdemannii]|uniref:3976_t:CDS:1 n=1 Tax=Ambispora gerdemannii TaxID=144530 RepID=A0A9N9G753_9GLOM|nr:3976_t:CDS:2 [Ambispora gerdemannii]